MDKVIITVAPTGAWGQKTDCPFIPLTPSEISQEISECADVGASIAHIHARDEFGKESISPIIFTDIVEKTTKLNDKIILNLTTAGPPPNENRMLHIHMLKPEMASYDCGSLNWNHKSVFINDPPFLEALGMAMQSSGTKPEIEIFDVGMMHNALYYLQKGILKPPLHFQFVLGVPGGMPATVKNLIFLTEMLPENATWSALGIGKNALPIMYAALALGAHGIRVGFEDNFYLSKGLMAHSNRELVEQAVHIVKQFNKIPATPDDAREILSLLP